MTDATVKAAPKAGKTAARSPFRRSSIVVGGAIVLFFVLLAALAGPLSAITGNDPYAEHPEALGAGSVPAGFGGGISARHWFGVTPLRGVDLFSIVAYGSRISLGIGVVSSVISLVIGVALGLLAGYFPGLVDALISRTMDVFFAFGPSTAGTIYAFGYTLLTGVLLNFVFGIFATRTMIRGAAAIKALRDPRLYGADAPGKIPAEKKQVNFVGLRKRFLTFSACLMAAIVLCAVVLGVHLDTEFTGGAMITLSYENSFEMSAVQKTASEALGSNGLTLQTGENVATGEQTLKISMPGTETVTTDEVQTLLDSLNESYPDNSFAQLSLSNVSAAMGTKFLQKSLVAVVFALVLILAYIAYRFKNIGGLTGGMMAVLALLNDLMVVFGTFVLLRAPLDGNFIAAMLTILGYSINDTVVVYDRIRENRGLLGKKASFEELVNHSVNQSARRTIITTVTTVMALGVMCIVSKLYGLDSIFTFAFPLMMGMLSGVYTSLCVSTSAWVAWSERKNAKKN